MDAAREKAGEAEALREYVRQAEVERQWRVARSEATAEDLSGPHIGFQATICNHQAPSLFRMYVVDVRMYAV